MDQEDFISIHNHLGTALENTDYAANLDEHAKELLADKTILAEIIQRLIPEFRGIPTEEIQTYINGTPYVSKIRLNPGETNPSFEEAVRSLGQESKIYYLARLLSSQYHRDFGHSEYEKLRKVYSIWIVMNPTERNANTISSIAFRQTALLGDPEDNHGYDKAEAFIVRLQKSEAEKSEDRLVSLLSMLFVSDLSPAEKENVLSRDYSIPVTEHMGRMVANMCNYSTYVLEKGMQQGIQQGMQQGIQQGMQQGIQQGIQQNAVTNIKALMETMNWNPLQAMNALRIPEEEQQKYTQLLKQ